MTRQHSYNRAYYGGRRANRLRGTVLDVQEVAPQLTAQKPLFKGRSGGTYAVKTTPKLVEGKIVDFPTNFIRVDKDARPVKVRKAARREARKQIKVSVKEAIIGRSEK